MTVVHQSPESHGDLQGENAGLQAQDLTRVSPELAQAVLQYLNLPPVGPLADADASPAIDTAAGYEVSPELRYALGQRRAQLDGFSELEQLLGIPQFGAQQLATICDRLGDLERYGNRIDAVWGGPAARHALFELVRSAEHSIHLEMYIVGGQVGLELAEALAQKRREGVEVRLLFTASGFVISGGPSGTGFVSKLSNLRSFLFNDMYTRKRILARLRQADIDFVDAAPIARHWKRKTFRQRGIKTAAQYLQWARSRGLPDDWISEQVEIDRVCPVGFAQVDHRKMLLVDGKRAWIGSQNIADSYLYDNELAADPRVNRKRWQWHDNSAIVEGPVVAKLNRDFAKRWACSGGDFFDPSDRRYAPPPERAGHSIFTIEPSLPGGFEIPMAKNWGRLALSLLGADRRPITTGSNPIRDRVVALPQLAQRELFVEHCYPSDADLLTRWAQNASHLDRFTMVVPHHYDTKLLGFECDRFFPEMQAAGVDLQGYNRAIMHSKIAVADAWYVSTGSFNLTLRSSRADLELQFFVQCPRYGQQVRDAIAGDLELCAPIQPSWLDRVRSKVSIPFIDGFMRYFLL